LHRLRSPEGHTVPVAFSADGRTLTTVGVALSWIGADKKRRVWDVASGKELRQLPDLTECSTYAVSPDGRTYAFAGKDKRIWLWDAVAERKLPVRIEHPKGIDNLGFSPDGRSLFAWCGDGKVHVWKIATGKEQRQFAAGNSNDVIATAFSPDGRWLAWGGRDRWIHLYDLATGQEVRRFMAASPFVDCLTFAPDGRTLAAASMYDPVIYLWETASGQVRHRLSGHEGRIFTVVFSAGSKRLLSGSDDSTALLWDLIGERGRVSAPSLRARWDELASADAETAYRAMCSLTAAGPTVDFLRKQLRPIPEPDPKRVAGLIADLDHDSFARREKATKDLENMGEAIESALRTAHDGAKSAEMRRRTEDLLARLVDEERQTPSAARLQILRAIEALERIDTMEARRLLRKLAGGAAGARQTREAKTALQRIIDTK
jgi:WD40 repeat protein